VRCIAAVLVVAAFGCVEAPPRRQSVTKRERVSLVYCKSAKPLAEIRIRHPSSRALAAAFVENLRLDSIVDAERSKYRPAIETLIHKTDVTSDTWRWLFPESVPASLQFNLRRWISPLTLEEELCRWLFPDVVPAYTPYGVPDDWLGVLVPYGQPEALWQGAMCPEPKILSDYLRRCQSDTK